MSSLHDSLGLALDRRRPLVAQLDAEQTDCYRLYHGTVEGEAGVTVDRYGPQLIIQSFHRDLGDDEVTLIVEQIEDRLGMALQPFYHARQHSQANPTAAKHSLFSGAEGDAEAVCRELGVSFRTRGVHRGIDPLLFLDMRAGRRYIQQHAQGLSVLNLFSYTCGVGVVAASAGARRVVNIDFARSALDVGRENAELNDLTDEQIEFVQSDFFPAARQLAGLPVKYRRQGRGGRRQPARNYPRLDACQFDLVFLDPPRWAKSPFGTVDLIRDYPSLFKPSLLATKPGGRLVCCNNVAQVDAQDWLDQLQRSAAKVDRPIREVEWLQPEADFPSFDGKHPLKMVVLHV
ncbi:class I SAM-dependent rRNA methyltransferase [Motiliproteus coralliicola]|uniref:Class I SAM-dependent rRNA methyltransferase n=1 Tax=Motiliproteus coralliicola TaxID=2283196 RepID=A0A369WUI2_9GAMM|nr:class I SAM-dependent rRNA methyltransferase [Motiliproteus coralliicola]